jgi:hypothetical protein
MRMSSTVDVEAVVKRVAREEDEPVGGHFIDVGHDRHRRGAGAVKVDRRRDAAATRGSRRRGDHTVARLTRRT